MSKSKGRRIFELDRQGRIQWLVPTQPHERYTCRNEDCPVRLVSLAPGDIWMSFPVEMVCPACQGPLYPELSEKRLFSPETGQR